MSRLPTHLEVSGLIRAAEAAGGQAMVLQRGDRDGGSLGIVTLFRNEPARLWERLPSLEGTRTFTVTRSEDTDNKGEFADYLIRRRSADPDQWLVEIAVPEADRFMAQLWR